VYHTKKGDATWDHVASLIKRSMALADTANSPPSMARQVPLPAFDTVTQDPSSQHVMQHSYMLAMAQRSEMSVSMPSTLDPSTRPPPNQMAFLEYPSMPIFDIDMANFDYMPDQNQMTGIDDIDYEALDAVFADPSWHMAHAMAGFDIETI
jgi:hypothetical protein